MGVLAQYSDLYNRVLPELRGADVPSLLRALQDGGRAFLGDSEVWRVWLDPVDLVASQVDYVLTFPYRADIRRIMGVRMNTTAGVTAGLEGDDIDESYYAFSPPDTLTLDDSLAPGTAVTDGLTVEVVLVPKLDAVEIPEWIFSRYAEGVMAYAKYVMMRQPEVPWSNPNMAIFYQREFRRKVGEAKAEASAGYKRGYEGGLEA